MYGSVRDQLQATLDDIRAAGLYKAERELASPQSASVLAGGQRVLNFCANNYLGLADHPDVVAAAKTALDEWGFGMASVRFICGTQTQHTELERRLSALLKTEATILYSSCFDANGGIFEVLMEESDAIISDELNHASIIDGIRLSKASRYRYRNRDMADLEAQLVAAAGARRRLIVTDGVFSMDGYLAPLRDICDLAERYDAMVMVDDSHAVGFVGPTGAGTPELAGVQDRVDIVSGTLGKALGGASGGYVSARTEIVELLRQRSRPYLFSNAVAPAVVAGSLAAIELAVGSDEARARLRANTELFRRRMLEEGFDLLDGEHAIVPVMFGDATLAGRIAEQMLALGVYVIAFSFPVVPKGKARIRVQLSAAHSAADVEACVLAFVGARAMVAASGPAGAVPVLPAKPEQHAQPVKRDVGPVVDEQEAYVRGAGGTLTRATVVKISAWFCILTLAVIAAVVGAQTASDNSRASHLRSHGQQVQVTLKSCFGIAGGTGITYLGFSCTGTFELNGHRFTEAFDGTNKAHFAGQVATAIVDPSHPSSVDLADTKSEAARPSNSGYVGAGSCALVALILLGLMLRLRRRAQGSAATPRTLSRSPEEPDQEKVD
jgi:glycine C-acetyltransferase